METVAVKIGQSLGHYDQRALVNRLGRCAACCEYIAPNKRKKQGQYFVCPTCAAVETSLCHA